MQHLAALDWSTRKIADVVGLSQSTVVRTLARRKQRHRVTYRTVITAAGTLALAALLVLTAAVATIAWG